VQSFLGFPNFYQRFIKGFSVIAQTLIDLTRKDTTFEWTIAAQTTFYLLKQAFMTAPVLLHPYPTKPFHVEMDASDFVIAAILSQQSEVRMLHPLTLSNTVSR
jgi:hypothetical protein